MAKKKRPAKSGSEGDKRRGRGKRRQIVKPGQYIFASVRVSHRRYLLRPTRPTKEAFQYIFAAMAEKWGVEVYAVCVMSNHYHAVLRDVRGVQPDFFRDVNRMLAQFLKAQYGCTGNIFRNKPNRVVLHHPAAVVDKIAYTLANPVSAAAVRFPHEWPGFRTRIEDMGLVRFGGDRPKHYFGKRKTLAKRASAALRFPTCVDSFYGTREAAMAALKKSLVGHVQRAHAAVRSKGWKYLGAERAQRISPFKRATSWEVFDALVPAFATLGLSKDEVITVKLAYLDFQRRYDDCRARFLDGERGVVWPAGTWAMVRWFGQRVEA